MCCWWQCGLKDWDRAIQATERVIAPEEKAQGVDASVQQQEAVDVAILDLTNTATIDESDRWQSHQPCRRLRCRELATRSTDQLFPITFHSD